MLQRTPLFLLLGVLAGAQFAQSRNLFVMPPGDGVLRPVAVYNGDPFTPGAGGVSAAQDTFLAFATPAGKFYFVSRSATDTVVITDANFQVTNRRSLGAGATSAALSPDGRFVVIGIGTSAQILNTSTDQIVGQVDAGGLVTDVAVSRDSTRAFVVSRNASRLTSIDLNSFVTIGAITVGLPNGVSVGPNGLVYVSATNILYEVDPRDLSFRGGTGISVNGEPGKPVFAADGTGSIRVLLTNSNPITGSSMIYVDLLNRTVTPVNAQGVVFDRIIPISGSRAFAVSTNQQLYDISLPSGVVPAAFSGLGTTSGTRSAVASNEFPNARYLYIASASTNTINRIDLASNSLSGSFALSSTPGPLAFSGPPATGFPSAVYTFNNGQFINPSSQSLPLIIRAVDSSGKPLQGVPVQFTTGAPGAFIVSSNASTDAEGYAQATVLAPSSFGQFVVTANVGSGVTVATNFTLTVGTGSTGPTGLVTIAGGNGQIVRESSTTLEPLRVVVRDSSGNPVPNAVVTWTVSTNNGPNGNLVLTQTVTDFIGQTTNTYIAPILGPNLLVSYVQSTITASTFSGQVTLYVTVIPNLFQGNQVPLPTATLVTPNNTDTIRGQVGTTLPAAIQVRIAAASGTQSGQPIPNVGIAATTGLDPSVAPTASCTATSGLSDSTGLANCDLVLGGKIGSTQLNVTVGGQTVTTLNLILDPGLPAKITTVQGDAQVGSAGQTLPLALLARVEDNFGNILPNIPVTWAVTSGSATLLNTITRSDNLARVSTLVRLGNTPGPSRITVTAQGGLSTATASFTVTTNIAVSQIRRVAGDGQSVLVNQPFPQPLVAQVLDANGAGIGGVQVSFSVQSGSATVTTPNATSDSAGNVSTLVTAGGAPGDVTIVASLSGTTVSWTLTVRPVGPGLTPAGVTNAASGLTGIAPGSIAIIRGTNIASSVRGYLLPPNDLGGLPTTLGGISVTFGGVAAPIFYVANIDGAESISVQVPFEVTENSTIPVTVNSGGGAPATVQVPISAYAPGIFENTDAQSRTFAVVVRDNGSFVTPDSPIDRGATGRVYVTGLGRTTAAALTNANGAGQRVTAGVVVGINDAGVVVTGAEYAQNLIGVYVVSFTVPQTTTPGLRQNFSVAVDAGGGNLVYSNGSTIAIR